MLADMRSRLLEVGCLEAALKTVTDTALNVIEADHASLRLCTDGPSLQASARSGMGTDRPAPSFSKGEGLLEKTVLLGRRPPAFNPNPTPHGWCATEVADPELEARIAQVLALDGGGERFGDTLIRSRVRPCAR